MKKLLFTALLIGITGILLKTTAQNTTVLPGTEFESGSIYYTVIDESTCQTKDGYFVEYQEGVPSKIISGNTSSGSVTIPEQVTYENNTYTVVKIGKFGFSGVTAISLPSTLKTIGDYAFINNDGITHIDIPASVDSIGNYVFYDCSSLESVNLPSTLANIGNYTFAYCVKLREIQLPSSLISIGNNTFYKTSLLSVEIPEGVTSIGAMAFEDCKSLANVNFPNTLISIGERAFAYCSALTAITIPQNVTQIGSMAFRYCTSLNYIECQASVPPAISLDTFGSNSLGGILQVYKTVYNAYKKSATWGIFSNITMIPVPATDISLDKTTLSINDGISATLTATLTPADATNTIEWSSSNSNMVEVTQTGKVIGHMLGTATVTASCGDYSATCEVTVIPNSSQSVTISPVEQTVYAGDEVTLTATVKPSTITSPVLWSTSNDQIAVIEYQTDRTGLLTAYAPGAVVITATCDGKTGRYSLTILPVEAESITVSPSTLTLKVGETNSLNAVVTPDNTTYADVIWASNNESVAIVSSDGTVTALGVGTATITALCGDVSDICTVTVEAIEADKIELSPTETSMTVGQSMQLLATVYPDNTTDKTVVWSSSSADIATVAQDGTVTAVSAGSAYITASCGNISATCQVSVSVPKPDDILINFAAVTVFIGQTQLLSVINPSSEATYLWSVDDPQIATVNDGLVTGTGAGTTTVTVTDGNSTATCEVTVVPVPVESITLDQIMITVNVESTVQLTATIAPADATDQTIIWSSDSEGIATVNSQGVITGIAPGTATVTATCGNVVATCTVTVLSPAKSITLNESQLTMSVGDMADLIATVNPENTTDVLEWTSEDQNVASVDQFGIVEAHSEGTTTITVTCGSVKAICEVTVQQQQKEDPDEPGTDEPGTDNPGTDSIHEIKADSTGKYHVYSLNGMHVLTTTDLNSLGRLSQGIYIVNGKKVYIRN